MSKHAASRPQASPVLVAYCDQLVAGISATGRRVPSDYTDRVRASSCPRSLVARNAFRAADWAARRFAPCALDVVGCKRVSEALRELPAVEDLWAARVVVGELWVRPTRHIDVIGAMKFASRAVWAAGQCYPFDAGNYAARCASLAVRLGGDVAWSMALGCLDDLLSMEG